MPNAKCRMPNEGVAGYFQFGIWHSAIGIHYRPIVAGNGGGK